MDISKAKILITGASGRLGSQLLYEFNRRGIRPIAHVRKESDTSYIDSLGLEKRTADLRNETELQTIVQGVDVVIHTASWISFRGDRLTQFTGINTFGAINLFKAAQQANVQRFVHISTVASVGGRLRSNDDEDVHTPLNEKTEYNLDAMRIPYFMSKRAAEVELLQLVQGKNTELVTVNPSIIIAPRLDGLDREQGDEFLRWSVMPNFRNYMNLVDIRDVAPGVIAALEKGKHKERYILGGDDITFRELVLTISALVGRVPHLVAPKRSWFKWYASAKFTLDKLKGSSNISVYPDLMKLLDYDWAFSSMKARQELGYSFRSVHVSLKDLLNGNFNGTYLRPNG